MFSSKHVGIDIGTENIKIAYIEKKRGKWLINKLHKIKNPIKNIAILEIDEKAMLLKCLKKPKGNLFYRKCILGLPSKYLVFRNIKFPKLNQKELKQALYWEAQNLSPMFKEEVISDFEMIEQKNDEISILLASVGKSYALNYAKVLDDTGFILRAIDIYPLAMSRMLNIGKQYRSLAIIDMGSSHCEINIFENGRIFASRNINFGGNNITKAVAQLLSLDEYGAEKIKRNPGDLKERIKNEIIYELEELMLEISRFFGFYSIQHKKPLEKIVLIGDGSKLWCLKDIFENYFKTEVVTANELSFEFGFKEKNADNPDYMDYFNAIGFALRG